MGPLGRLSCWTSRSASLVTRPHAHANIRPLGAYSGNFQPPCRIYEAPTRPASLSITSPFPLRRNLAAGARHRGPSLRLPAQWRPRAHGLMEYQAGVAFAGCCSEAWQYEPTVPRGYYFSFRQGGGDAPGPPVLPSGSSRRDRQLLQAINPFQPPGACQAWESIGPLPAWAKSATPRTLAPRLLSRRVQQSDELLSCAHPAFSRNTIVLV